MNTVLDKPDTKPESKARLGVTEWLSIAQLVALLAAGAWTAFTFMRFDARDKAITAQRNDIELRKLRATPLKFSQSIDVSNFSSNQKANGAKRLAVDYHYSITNTTTQQTKIALVVVHAMLLSVAPATGAQTLEIPALGLSKNSLWRNALSKAYLADDEEVEGGVVKTDNETIVPIKGGGPVGDLEPSESSWGSLTILVVPADADYIGFTIDAYVRFDDKTKPRWIGGHQYASLVVGEYSDQPTLSNQPDNAIHSK